MCFEIDISQKSLGKRGLKRELGKRELEKRVLKREF